MIMSTALKILNDYIDPWFPNGIPTSDAELIAVPSDTAITEWVTWSGTYYSTLNSVPWQSRGSAVEVPARE